MKDDLPNAKGRCVPVFSMGQLSLGYYGVVLLVAWLFLLFYAPGVSTTLFSQAEFMSASYITSAVSLATMLAVFAFFPKASVDASNRRPWDVIAPVLMSIGTVMCIMFYLDLGLAWGIVGGIITGVTSATMAVRWVHEYGKLDLNDLFTNLPMIATVSVILCFSLLFFPSPIMIGFLVCAPLFSGWALSYVRNLDPRLLIHDPPVIKHDLFAYLCIVISIGLIGFSTGFLDFTATGVDGMSYSSVFYLLIAAVLFVSAGWYIRLHRRRLFSSAFTLPFCMLVVVLIPYLQVFSSPSIVFISLGEISFEVLLMLLSAAYAFYFGVSAVRVFCLGRIAMAVFDLLGWFLAMNLRQTVLSESGPQFVLLCAFLGAETVCLIVFAALLLGRGHSNDEADIPDEGRRQARDIEYAEMVKRKCILLQDEFSLSARELDVLTLLARGYSAAAIQEHLHIAPGTVNSHTRNIYRKLDVHSKSEIIDFVEHWGNNIGN